MPSNNSIQMIHPYSHEGMWVFDDAAVGLPEALEAFNKELRDSGTTVTEVGGLPITGSQFIFPGRKARRPAPPPDDAGKEATDGDDLNS